MGINRPVRLMDKLADMDPQHRAAVMQQMQLVPGDPRLQQVVGIEHDISDLDVDITVEEGIDIPSLQQEEFQSLVQLASLQPGLIPGDVLIAASGLRDKDQILEQMKQHQQQQAQAQQAAGQAAQQHAQAQVADMQSKAAANMALAKERTVNAASTIHDAHRTFMGLPDDNATQVQAPPQPENPEQMQPDVAMAHHLTDLASKHLDMRRRRKPDISKTRADTLLTAAKIPQVAQSDPAYRSSDQCDGCRDEQADAHAHSTAAAARRCAMSPRRSIILVVLILVGGLGGGYYGYRGSYYGPGMYGGIGLPGGDPADRAAATSAASAAGEDRGDPAVALADMLGAAPVGTTRTLVVAAASASGAARSWAM